MRKLNLTSWHVFGSVALAGGMFLTGCAPAGVFGERKSTAMTDGNTVASTDMIKTANKTTKAKPAVDQDTGTYGQLMAKARSLEAGGRWDEAKIIYDKLAVDFPKRHEAYHRLGVVSDHRRRHTDAAEFYAKALSLHPNDAEVLNDLGYCYFMQGQMSKAEAYLMKAVATAPDNTRFRNNLGLVHGHQGKTDIALADFRKAGSEADAQYNLAFILAAKNDTSGAKRCFQNALAADPNFEPARKALRSFERAETDPNSLADYDDATPQGVRLVPFVESESGSNASDNSKVQRAVATSSNSTGSNTRALQSQARSMMQERLSSNQQSQER